MTKNDVWSFFRHFFSLWIFFQFGSGVRNAIPWGSGGVCGGGGGGGGVKSICPSRALKRPFQTPKTSRFKGKIANLKRKYNKTGKNVKRTNCPFSLMGQGSRFGQSLYIYIYKISLSLSFSLSLYISLSLHISLSLSVSLSLYINLSPFFCLFPFRPGLNKIKRPPTAESSIARLKRYLQNTQWGMDMGNDHCGALAARSASKGPRML